MDPGETAAPNGLLRCPTPVSSYRPLISHRISAETCERRQRDLYHKCLTCLNSARRQARYGQLFRDRVLELAEPAPVLGPTIWPAHADAQLPLAAPAAPPLR